MNRAAALPDRPISTIPALSGRAVAPAGVERRCGWLHKGGWCNDPTFHGDKRGAPIHLLALDVPQEMEERLVATNPLACLSTHVAADHFCADRVNMDALAVRGERRDRREAAQVDRNRDRLLIAPGPYDEHVEYFRLLKFGWRQSKKMRNATRCPVGAPGEVGNPRFIDPDSR